MWGLRENNKILLSNYPSIKKKKNSKPPLAEVQDPDVSKLSFITYHGQRQLLSKGLRQPGEIPTL